MQVAELFVNLGIKNDNKAVQALEKVKGTLGEVSTSGLAAKAGILGAVYGMQQLMSHSASAGASLMSYSAATGLSAETLQRWQYAARQANVGAEEMENAITGVQSAMIKFASGQGQPGGFNVINNAVGIDPSRIRDTMYMMGKLSQYAKTEGNVDFANEQLKTFGLSLDMISAMRRNTFSEKNLNAAPVYSDAEASKLQKVDVAWSNLGRSFEMAIGHLNAKHGLGFVEDLSGASKDIINMLSALAKLVEKTNALKALSLIFQGWGQIFGLITAGVNALNDYSSKNTTKELPEMEEDNSDTRGMLMRILFGTKMKMGDMTKEQEAALKKDLSAAPARWNALLMGGPIPERPSIASSKEGHPSSPNVNMTVHNHGVKDAKDGAHHLKRAIQSAGNQLQSKVRAN